jgi:hypothetical protein
MNNSTKVMLGSCHDAPFITDRQAAPYYKNSDDFERKQPQPIRKVHVDVLDLSKEQHKYKYAKIWEAAGYNLARVADEERHWNEETKSFIVYVRWYFVAQMDPGELRTLKLNTSQNLYEMMDKESNNGTAVVNASECGDGSSAGDSSGGTADTPEAQDQPTG